MIAPGSVEVAGLFELEDLNAACRLLSPDSLVAVQLSALHNLAASLHERENQDLIRNCSGLIAVLRALAATANAFVFGSVAFILYTLNLPVPSFRSDRSASGGKLSARDVMQWSIDDVCAWVGCQCFKAYRHLFRDSFVSGRILMSLSDEDLATMGIPHAIHRRSVIFAIGDLKEDLGSETDSTLQGLARMTSIAVAEEEYDVFLSYRRQGGADFAHLLKLSLTLMGLTVFLDIDNLGTGNFDSKLVSSLQNSSNVILVWSKGCMDRFLSDGDPLLQDFVRKEYTLALRYNKNIVPVYKEDFVFPEASSLPDDVKPILNLNAIKFIGEYRDASLEKIKKSLVLIGN